MDKAEQFVAGLEVLGSYAYALEMATIQGTLPDAVKQQLTDLAVKMATKIDELRTLAQEAC